MKQCKHIGWWSVGYIRYTPKEKKNYFKLRKFRYRKCIYCGRFC